MNILFLCKHNVFRSRTAEAYFKKINKNKNLKISSAGPLKGEDCSKNQKKALKEEKIKFISKPKGLSVKLLRKQDLLIIVANDLPIILFNNKDYNKKVISWDIPDVLDDDKQKSHKTIQMIKNKVEELVEELK